MIPTAIETKALELWREREMTFPKFCRRMTPDDIDMVSGAWARCIRRAEAMVGFSLNDPTLERGTTSLIG